MKTSDYFYDNGAPRKCTQDDSALLLTVRITEDQLNSVCQVCGTIAGHYSTLPVPHWDMKFMEHFKETEE